MARDFDSVTLTDLKVENAEALNKDLTTTFCAGCGAFCDGGGAAADGAAAGAGQLRAGCGPQDA